MKKYDLFGVDGNAYAIISYVISCMENEGKTKVDIDEYIRIATSSDYYNLVSVSVDMIENLNDNAKI